MIGPQGIQNLRLPELDLDLIYGGDPNDDAIFKEGIFEADRYSRCLGRNLYCRCGFSDLCVGYGRRNIHFDAGFNLVRVDGGACVCGGIDLL